MLINFACKLRIRFATLFEKHLYIRYHWSKHAHLNLHAVNDSLGCISANGTTQSIMCTPGAKGLKPGVGKSERPSAPSTH